MMRKILMICGALLLGGCSFISPQPPVQEKSLEQEEVTIDKVDSEAQKTNEEISIVNETSEYLFSSNTYLQNPLYLEEADELEQELYRVLSDGMKKGETVISVSEALKDQSFGSHEELTQYLSASTQMLIDMEPMFFYVDRSGMRFEFTYHEKDGAIYYQSVDVHLQLKPEYESLQAVVEEGNAMIEIAKAICDQIINEHESNQMRLLAAHDYLILNTAYLVGENEYDNTATSCLLRGVSRCHGYALSFQFLSMLMQMESHVVIGLGTNETGTQPHAWNYVVLEDQGYFVDVTFDDPMTLEASLSDFIPMRSYFLRSKQIMDQNHVLEKPESLDAPSSEVSLFIEQDRYFETFEAAYDRLYQAMWAAQNEGETVREILVFADDLPITEEDIRTQIQNIYEENDDLYTYNYEMMLVANHLYIIFQ